MKISHKRPLQPSAEELHESMNRLFPWLIGAAILLFGLGCFFLGCLYTNLTNY